MVRQVGVWQLNYKRVKQNLATEQSSGVSCTWESTYWSILPVSRWYLKMHLASWEFTADFIKLVFVWKKRQVTFILVPNGDSFAIWGFPMPIIHLTIFPVNICWASAVYSHVLGAPKWVKSISTLKQFVV